MNIKNTVYAFLNRIICNFCHYIPIGIHLINTNFSSLRTLLAESQATGISRLQNKVGKGTRSLWKVTHFRWFSVFWIFERIQCLNLYLYLLQGSEKTSRRLKIKTLRFAKRRHSQTASHPINWILSKLGICAVRRHSCTGTGTGTQPPLFKWHGALWVQLWVANPDLSICIFSLIRLSETPVRCSSECTVVFLCPVS